MKTPNKMINKYGNRLEKTEYGSYIDPDETSSYAQDKNAMSYEEALSCGYKPVKE